MCPGIVNYSDLKNGGTELYKKPVIDEALATLIGSPLTIGHVPTKIEGSALMDYENGRIDKAEFDATTGWFVCEGTVETEQARDNINAGHGISVGIRVAKYGPGGFWLNNEYDREITKFRFHHLAIVPPDLKPRFEDAAIRLNATAKPKNTMFSWIKKKIGAAGVSAEETSTLAPDTKIDIGGGQSVALKDLVEHERNNHVHAVCAEDYIEHEGVRYNCGALVNNYRDKMNAGRHVDRPNATPPVDESPEDKAKREVVESATAVGAAKTKLDEATTAAARDNATEADKTALATAKTEHETAFAAANQAAERLNSMNAAATAQAQEKQRLADEATKAENDRKAEETRQATERDNAEKVKRAAGIESFAILSAANTRGAPDVAIAPITGRAGRLAVGKKLFGSDVGAGKN